MLRRFDLRWKPLSRRTGWKVALIALVLLPTAGQSSDEPSEGRPNAAIQVAVSVPPQAFFVERVGGDRVAVQVMIPPSSSPATFDPSPRQMVDLHKARLYVKVGHPGFAFERRHLDGLLARIRGLEVVDMNQEAEPLLSAEAGAAGTDIDSHLWLAPPIVAATAQAIADRLSRIDPGSAERFQRNLGDLLGDIRSLDREIRSVLDGLPRRSFVVYHPAWGHFAAHYGLVQLAIESGGKEPSPAALVALIEETKRERVRVVFVQKGFSDRSARVLAREIGARVEVLDPLARDWSDNLRRVASALRGALADG